MGILKKHTQYTIQYGGVIWHFLQFSKMDHCCRSVIFLVVQFQKIGKFRHARMESHTEQSFHFQKNTRTLKLNKDIVILFANTFLLLQRIIAKNKIGNLNLKKKC